MSKTDDVGEDAPTNACGFRLLPGQEVTVLASKTSGIFPSISLCCAVREVCSSVAV